MGTTAKRGTGFVNRLLMLMRWNSGNFLLCLCTTFLLVVAWYAGQHQKINAHYEGKKFHSGKYKQRNEKFYPLIVISA
ncbi:MAG: hypothetical protein IM581_07590 [Chitinophagaceae bacterium]|nr:hypothetical protein [Chitinophagaceae bacterium]